MVKKQICIILLFSCIYFIAIEGCDECKLYEAPSNIKFPYGDEYHLNTDVSANDTNKIICADKHKLLSEQGRCPFPPEDPEDMKLTNPYVRCPSFPELRSPDGVTFGEPIPPSSVQCKSCDLKLTRDNSAVILKCTECYDVPSTERKANCTQHDLLYKVFFIEIANYTSVDVQGKENF